MYKKPYVIAEVGSNHLGNKIFVLILLNKQKKLGQTVSNFNSFDENNLVNKKMKIYKHVKDKKLKYQYQRFKKVKISFQLIKKLFEESKK